MKKYIYILILIVLFSCEKKIDWDLKNSGNQYLIVESIITNENKYQSVKISYSVTDINLKPEMISGANVVVFDGDNYFTFSEDSTQKGVYFSSQKFIGVVNKKYKLSIIYNGKTYTALAYMYPVSDFEIIKYAYNENENLYYLTSFPSQFSLNENAMYEINISWDTLPAYIDLPYEKTHATVYYYTLVSIDIPEIISPESERVFFPKGSVITERKYSVSHAHAEFIRSLLLETTWRGSIFDLEQGNVLTNLSGGALGFFAACSVIEKQIIVE